MIKLKEFEKTNENNSKFKESKFQHFWRSMLHYYEHVEFEKYQDHKMRSRRKAEIVKLPSDLIKVEPEEKEGLIGGIRNIGKQIRI